MFAVKMANMKTNERARPYKTGRKDRARRAPTIEKTATGLSSGADVERANAIRPYC